ncbi:MAG: hypothetical protein KDJ65_06860 [Anaerolineae bacterium]|nr:hypothetical protein [Anaerolineae bacterium]
MEHKFSYYILMGLIIGVFIGTGLGTATEYIIFRIGVGALFGTFIGWFIAAAVLEGEKKKRRHSVRPGAQNGEPQGERPPFYIE